MTIKSKVPQIRFKGFDGEWEKNRLKELTEILRCGIAATPQYVDDGVVFLSSQNVTNSGKINLEKFNYISEEYYKKISKNAKLLKGDILYTRVGAGFGNSTVFPYDGDYGVYVSLTHIRTNKNLNNKFLNHLLNSPICKEQAENGVFQGGGVPNLNVKIVENFNIVYPKTENEQIKIGDYFQQLDKLIEQKEKKYQKLKQFKKAMLDKMFPKNGDDTPEIRFKGFSGKWEEKSLEEIVDRYDNLRIPISASNRIAGDTPYYGANGIQDYVQGFTHDGEFILVAEDGANDLKNYPVQYVNGKIWVNNHAHVLQAKKDISSNKFLKYSISKINIEPFLVGGGRAKLNANIMMKINIYVPLNLQELEKIGNYFYKLDSQIDLQQKELEKLKNIKKASLAKMFV